MHRIEIGREIYNHRSPDWMDNGSMVSIDGDVRWAVALLDVCKMEYFIDGMNVKNAIA